MSNEVELKLAVTSDAFDTLKTHLNQYTDLEEEQKKVIETIFWLNKKWDCVSVGKIMISHLP